MGRVKWFDEEMGRLSQIDKIDSILIRWTDIHVAGLSPTERQELRELVKDKPYHPRRAELEIADAEASGKPVSTTYALYSFGVRGWRFNSDDTNKSFADRVFTPQDSWERMPSGASVFDNAASNGGQVKAPGVLPHRNVFRPALGRLLFSGLWFLPSFDYKVQPVSVRGSRWVLPVVTSGSPPKEERYELRGEIDATTGVVRLTELECVASPNPSGVGELELFESYKFVEAVGRELPHQVRKFHAERKPFSTLILREVASLPSGEFERLTPVPRPGLEDAIRGPLLTGTYTDFVRGTIAELREGQELKSSPIPNQGQRISSPASINSVAVVVPSKPFPWWIIGLSASAIVVGGVFYWRWKRG